MDLNFSKIIMSFLWLYFLTCLCLIVGLEVELSNAQIHKTYGHRLLPTIVKTITVDSKGGANFSTIQSAINSIPSNNSDWTAINIKAGYYREKLRIERDKPYIILQGEGMKKTVVEWDDHASTSESPTFSALANNTVVKQITFKNSYNDPGKNNQILPALAATISGDKLYFNNVGFLGYQDTLWDDTGRHYFKKCFIQGAIDFIFGAGQSLYEECKISVKGSGFITAQARSNPNDANGFVFKDCNVFGVDNTTTYLGRPWREYARVLFYNTNMSSIVQPLGWDPWDYRGHENDIEFSESNNYGPGSNTSNRVKWMKQLDTATINKMASTGFIDNEGWINNQRF